MSSTARRNSSLPAWKPSASWALSIPRSTTAMTTRGAATSRCERRWAMPNPFGRPVSGSSVPRLLVDRIKSTTTKDAVARAMVITTARKAARRIPGGTGQRDPKGECDGTLVGRHHPHPEEQGHEHADRHEIGRARRRTGLRPGRSRRAWTPRAIHRQVSAQHQPYPVRRSRSMAIHATSAVAATMNTVARSEWERGQTNPDQDPGDGGKRKDETEHRQRAQERQGRVQRKPRSSLGEEPVPHLRVRLQGHARRRRHARLQCETTPASRRHARGDDLTYGDTTCTFEPCNHRAGELRIPRHRSGPSAGRARGGGLLDAQPSYSAWLFGSSGGRRSHVIEDQRGRTRRLGHRQIVRRVLDDPKVGERHRGGAPLGPLGADAH